MSDNNSTDSETQPRGVEAVKNHMLENKIETALWISRVLSIVFAIGYVLPLFGCVSLLIENLSIINDTRVNIPDHHKVHFTKSYWRTP